MRVNTRYINDTRGLLDRKKLSFFCLACSEVLLSQPWPLTCESQQTTWTFMMMSWCLMSSDVIWHIRDKLWPMPKHGSIKATYVRCMRVLAVTCHLHFWQNDRDFLRATVVTRGWNGYRNKSQHRKSTLEKKILLPFQQGFEPATFQSRVQRSNHWAIPAPIEHLCQHIHFIPGQKCSKVKNCFYIVLCFALKQTRCAFVTCYSVTLFKDENIPRLKITSAFVYSAILRSWSDSPKFLSHVILNGWAVAFCSMFLNIHQSRVLTPLKMPLGDWLFYLPP